MEQIFDLNSFLNYVKLHLHSYDVQERKSSEDLFTEIQFVLSWSVFKEKRFVEKRKAFLRELFDLLTDFESILNANKNGNRILKRSLEILKIIRNNEEDASLQYSLNAILAKRITDYLSVTVFDKISVDFDDHKSISNCEIRIFERLLLIDTTFEFSFVTSNDDVISQEIVSLLSIALSIDNSKLCGNLCSNVLAKYLRSDKISIRDKDRLLISVFRTLYDRVDGLSGKEESVCLSIYSILISLNEESSDLSIDQNLELLEILQTIIQRCLASAHNFIRKLARELLKIVILLLNFDAGKRQIFLDYITFLDVLEEKQVHLIKPALIQLDSILKQAENANSSLRNSFTFDISWALIIFRNGFTHLNGYVAKAMVVKYFQQSPYRCPGLVGQKSQLLLDFALPALKDGDFYQRCIDDNVLESFLDSLKTFLSEVIQISNEHANIFFDFILSIFQSKNWGPVPLMFLCHVLMTLPDLPEIWNETNFDQLRCSFYALLQGSSPYFRAAIQECLFHLSFRLIDWSVTSPWKFAPNVFPFVSEDLYKYGSKYFSLARYLWKDVKEEISFENESFVTNDLNDNNRKSIVAVSLIRSDRKVMDEIITKINHLLDNVSQRPYVDQNKVIAHLQILADMLSLYPSELLTSVVTKLNIGNVLQFIISLNNENFKIDFLTLWQSSVLLISSLSERKLSEWKSDFDHFKNNLVEQCLSDSATIVRKCFCLKLLNACNGNLSTKQTEKLFQSLVSASDKISTDILIPNKTDSQIFVAQYRSIQWKVIGRLLLNCKNLATIEMCSFTEIIFDMFDHADDETIHEILNCLDLLIKKIPVISTDLLLKIIDRSKRVIFDMSKSDLSISSLKFLISIMLVGYCKITNGKTENETSLLTLIKKILNDLHDEGAQNNSVCYQVAKQFYICITNNLDYQEVLIKTFHEILVKFCLFSNVIRRDQNEHLAAQKCRIFALLLIEQYFEAHGDDVESLAQLLQTTMNATLESADGKIRTKYYALSYCHRVRTRALQLLVLLQPFIAEKRLANDLITFCKDLLTVEGQLGSIRLLLEILVVRLVLAFPSPFLEDWLNSVNEMGTKRIGSLCSWVQVVMHVLLSLVNVSNSVSLCERCINSILPLCTAQNFTVRCCAQSVLKRIWIEYEYKFVDDDRLISFKNLIDNCVNFTMENRNATKNVEKTLSDFYFSTFDMQKHYTLEAVFQLLPEKCHLPIDEWLELDLMKKCVGNTVDHLKFMPSRYVDENLQKAKSIIWTGTSQTISEGDEFVSTKFDALQTKAFVELDTSLRSSAGLQEKDKPPSNQQCQLIVVASLIDRPTNLGGLCRTCEVFGATEFVIGSLKYVEDSQFQSLSVSSERWMNITEVSETCLTAGVHSVEFVFLPFAPLRIFRNEKEGIPPVLIQHLDHCIVIPQVGVIRSMNVHVAGAMLIWEYAKQHRLK